MSISRLQGTYSEGTGQISSLAYGSTLSANSLLIVTALWCDNSDYPTHPTVSGTQNGSFGSVIAGYYDATLAQGMAIFAIVNTKGAVSETINFSWYSSCDYCSVVIEEFSGVSVTTDGTAHQSQSSLGSGTDNISSTAISTTTDGDLIYAVTSSAGGASHVTAINCGTGFTQDTVCDPTWVLTAEYMVQTTHGSQAGTFSPTNSGGTTNWTTIAAAFKAASGGTTISISKGALSLSGKASHVNEAYIFGHGTLALSPKALHVNEAYVVPKAALSISAKTLHVNEVVAITRTALSFTGKSLTVLSGNVIAIAKAALTATGQALHVNEAFAVARGAMSVTGKALHVNEAVAIGKKALNATGQALHVNEVVSIVKVALALSGKTLNVLGATVVSITAGAIAFTGRSVAAATGALGAIRRYISTWTTWTSKPKSGGM